MKGKVRLKNINIDVISEILANNCVHSYKCVIYMSNFNCPFEKDCDDITPKDWESLLIKISDEYQDSKSHDKLLNNS